MSSHKHLIANTTFQNKQKSEEMQLSITTLQSQYSLEIKGYIPDWTPIR